MSRVGTPQPVYMDNNSTTALDPRVLEAMLPYFTEAFGNPSSRHAYGVAANDAIEVARAQVAALLSASASEIVFTSGATESSYSAVLGACRGRRGHVVTSSVEHKSILGATRVLEEQGFAVTYLSPERDGSISVEAVAAAIRPDTVFVSLMLVNNEVGSLSPISEIGALLRQRGVLFHCDAAQAVGKIVCDVGALNVDFLSASAHKIHGPKGVGALYVREAVRSAIVPLMRGGGQESGLRGGTQNVPGIVGFGRACELSRDELAAESTRVRALRDRLLESLRRAAPDAIVNGSLDSRVPGNLSVSFPGVGGERLLEALAPHLAVSSGSACAAGSHDVSHVLRAMGVPDELARATLRFGLGRFSTVADVERAATVVGEALVVSREKAPAPTQRTNTSNTDGTLSLRPIGSVGNGITEPAYIPWEHVQSRIEVDPSFAAALSELAGYSHVIVVSWMHLVETQKLEHVPQGLAGDVPVVGMFACRCPYRPNPIAVSTARIVAVEENAVVVEGLDVVNGTPVLDIKPYTPPMDAPKGEVRTPAWTSRLTY